MNKKNIYTRRGFTIIELMIVILVIGILATIGIQKFMDLAANATKVSEDATVAAINTGISNYQLNEAVK